MNGIIRLARGPRHGAYCSRPKWWPLVKTHALSSHRCRSWMPKRCMRKLIARAVRLKIILNTSRMIWHMTAPPAPVFLPTVCVCRCMPLPMSCISNCAPKLCNIRHCRRRNHRQSSPNYSKSLCKSDSIKQDRSSSSKRLSDQTIVAGTHRKTVSANACKTPHLVLTDFRQVRRELTTHPYIYLQATSLNSHWVG